MSHAAFEPGPSDELVALAAAAADGVDGDLQAWADWLGCAPVGTPSDGVVACDVGLSSGPARAVLVDWFTMMAEDDGQVDMSSALLLSTLGPSQIASGLCPDDPERSATIVAAPLAPGYDLLFADQQLTPEQRLDAADEVAAAMSRKLRATGLDATELGGAEVLRCTELDDG